MGDEDRVSELYRGDISPGEPSRVCRDRLHWICRNLQGKRVLDVGCSQGMVSILAAREGYEVVGVDVEPSVIAFAEADWERESEAVRARLRFIQGDIYDENVVPREKFDAVIAGEVLEHQATPRRFVERIASFLKPGGLLVGTTPFGLHTHQDHKFTFFLSNLLGVFEDVISVRSLDVVDGYVRFLGALDPTTKATVTTDELLALSEKAFADKELRLWRTDDYHRRKLQKAQSEQGELVRELSELRQRLAELEAEQSLQERSRADLEAKLEETKALAEKRRRLAEKLSTGRLPQKPKKKITPPPTTTAPRSLRRGASALMDAVQREVRSGRIRRDPVTSLRKTFAKVRRETLGKSLAKLPLRSSIPMPVFKPFVAPKPAPLTIATILDEFSQSCFQYEANLIPMSREGWRAQLEEQRPDFFLAESAWRGNANQWRYVMTRYDSSNGDDLRALIGYCKAEGIPTVFWNKEDPPNFEVFKNVAAEFDYVFTSDAECVPKYREFLPASRIGVLPFAAQPAIHNPIRDGVRSVRSVCFAGSWRADKYPERVKETEMILRPALGQGLDIFDRQGDVQKEGMAFPPPFNAVVRGGLKYPRMLSAYRRYKVFLNVNSVRTSPTMFSRRVFEIMACATPVLTAEAEGISRMFGSLVKSATTEPDVERHLSKLLSDDDYRDRLAHVGYREVMESHTYTHRLREICKALRLDLHTGHEPLVTIIAATNRPDRFLHLLGSIRRQTYPNIEVVFVLNSSSFDRRLVDERVAGLSNARVVEVPEQKTLADCLNAGVEIARGEWISKFDDDDHYGPHYLSDLLLSTKFTDAKILGKCSYYSYLEGSQQMALRFPNFDHRHASLLHGATLTVHRSVFDQVKFTPVRQGTDTIFLRECQERGTTLYSADRYNFIHVRGANLQKHTWKISDAEFLKKCRVTGRELDCESVMI